MLLEILEVLVPKNGYNLPLLQGISQIHYHPGSLQQAEHSIEPKKGKSIKHIPIIKSKTTGLRLVGSRNARRAVTDDTDDNTFIFHTNPNQHNLGVSLKLEFCFQ